MQIQIITFKSIKLLLHCFQKVLNALNFRTSFFEDQHQQLCQTFAKHCSRQQSVAPNVSLFGTRCVPLRKSSLK